MMRSKGTVASAASELDRICTLASPDIDEATLSQIRQLIDITSERSEIDPTWCVIGMLGGTGAGKSSLVNAMSGGEVVTAGVRRPTTNEPCAVLPVGRAPRDLLGWLGVARWVEAPRGLPGDTVVIDMPDIDSVESSHAEIAEHLASRVDALVVVVNPQKYADARLHDEWLARLHSSHASVTVVLTHIDTVVAAERDSIERDLRRLLSERGMKDATVVSVSSTTGEGVQTLVKHLSKEAERVSRQASRSRQALREAAVLIRDAVGIDGTIRGIETDGMASDLSSSAADLAGAPIIAEAVAASTVRAGRRAGGWLPLRWVARLGADPLRRLHLDEESRSEGATTPTLPTRSPSDVAAFVNAVRREVAQRSSGRPSPWRARLMERALEGARDVPAVAHREVSDNMQVATGAPSTSRLLGGIQVLAWVVCLVGAAWIGLVHLGRAVLIDWRVPALGPVPAPTALVGLSLLVTVILAGINRGVSRWAAGRRRRAVMRDLRGLCRDEVERAVVAPVRAEDNRQVTIASYIARLRL